MGQIDDVARCVTMDLKQPGNVLYLVGETRNELGGSHFALVNRMKGGQVPTVNAEVARETFAALHRAMQGGLVRSCHDMSEGGLAVAAAEMAFAGGCGVWIGLDHVPSPLWSQLEENALEPVLLFAESNSRFLCEISPEHAPQFERIMSGIPFGRVGEVREETSIQICGNSQSAPLIDVTIERAKEAWQAPLKW
jgi:phosphoribosylformylglycinamidine synthase